MEEQAVQTGKITITYETLFDIVLRERNKDELQPLPATFFKELVDYLKEKRGMLSILNQEDQEKTSAQLQKINRQVKELYERREKKIISLALTRSRAAADIIDTSSLLAEEKALFENLVRQLDSFRDAVLNSLLLARMPTAIEHPSGAETLAAATAIMTAKPVSAIGGTNFPSERNAGKSTKLIRFLHAVPKFVGRELEVYGPFEQEDIANLPREIAEVLITKGRAQEIAEA